MFVVVRVGGACSPPPPVAAALASSLRAPSRGDPPHDGPAAAVRLAYLSRSADPRTPENARRILTTQTPIYTAQPTHGRHTHARRTRSTGTGARRTRSTGTHGRRTRGRHG